MLKMCCRNAIHSLPVFDAVFVYAPKCLPLILQLYAFCMLVKSVNCTAVTVVLLGSRLDKLLRQGTVLFIAAVSHG